MYFGNFTNYQTMIAKWGDIKKEPIPRERDVLFASYGSEEYEGDALVLFLHEGKIYEVNGGHCSCYGLSESSYSGASESQWSPEETSWAALKNRTLDRVQHSEEAVNCFKSLVETYTQCAQKTS